MTSTQPVGLTPSDLRDAYKLGRASSVRGQGQTIAVVDAFDDPNAEADLATYRSAFGLQPCTSSNGCFRKVNQQGSADSYPSPNAEWAYEISTDLDLLSAICPRCHLLLVEANDNVPSDMAEAARTAVVAGATVVSNSYGGAEFSDERSFDRYYDQPGVPMVFGAGDSTYNQVFYPAASPFVVAVGGTTLYRAANPRGWSETVADGTASGCSLYEPKPSWQHDTGCKTRTINDVAAVFNTKTTLSSPIEAGAAVYDTFAPPTDPTTAEAIAVGHLSPASGWTQGGGTSAAAQVVAAVFALAGNGRSTRFARSLYLHADRLFDITSGTNGDGVLPSTMVWPLQNIVVHDCGNYLCRAGPGYDGPTGNGTPNGIGAF